MRRDKWKKAISLVLVAAIAVSAVGCTPTEGKTETVAIEPMEAETSYALSYDIIGGKDVMPIGGFFGPYSAANFSPNAQTIPNFFTDEYMQALADCGVNFLPHTESDTSGDLGKTLLDLGAKYGIGVYIKDDSILAMKGKDNKVEADIVSAKLAEYRNHPAFCGLYVVDEPGGKTYWTKPEGNNMEDYDKLTEVLHNTCDVDIYTNLIRINSKEQKDIYKEYLEEYCTTMHPSAVVFDLYPWDEGNTKSIYLYNFALARQAAQKYNLPLWTYLAAGSYWDDNVEGLEAGDPKPLEGQFDWSINTSLAMGAQGLLYFMLFQPYYFSYTTDPDVYDFERNGLFGAMGNKNRWYYYAQDASKQIQAIDHVLMNSVSKGVISSGKEASADISDAEGINLEGDSWRELKKVTGNALTGCFNYQGKSAFYVVNYDSDYAQDITVDFQGTYKMEVIQNGESKYVKTSKLELVMAAGEGVLIVME